jgi:hypothetical protein
MAGLEGVKVGDKLFVSIGSHDYELRTVAKINKATVADECGTLWNTDTGARRGRSRWSCDRAMAYEPEKHDERLNGALQRNVRSYMNGIRWRDMGWEVVEACYKIVREADKKDEAKEAAQ